MRRNTALPLVLLLCATLGVPSLASGAHAAGGPTAGGPTASQRGKRARQSPAFAKINEVRELLRALETASAAERLELVARADRLIGEVRRIDPEFDAARLEQRLEPYRGGTAAPVAAPSPQPKQAADRTPEPLLDPAAYQREKTGRIVFFRSATEKGRENPADEATSFGPGDRIYGIAYLDKSFKEMTYVPSRDGVARAFEYAVEVDGERIYTFSGFYLGLTWDEYQDTTRKHAMVPILPDAAELGLGRSADYNLPISFGEMLAKLSPGRHTIKIELIGEYKPQATGTFEIDASGDPGWLATAVADLKSAKNRAVTLPAPKMRNAALERSMAQALEENGWRQQILKVVITTPSWRIHRNAFGAIEFRSLNTTVALKEPDGRCRLFGISFKQPHLGGGRYGRTEQYGVGDNLDIACENTGR